MSRAFVKETDTVDVRRRVAPELPVGTPNHTTPWGAGAVRQRIAELLAARQELAGRDDGIAVAARAELEAEQRYLESRAATFVETEPPDPPPRVMFGTTVEVEGEDGVRTFAIVGVDEVDASRGRISWISPIARALIGAQPGDEVVARTPGGEEVWEVLAVSVVRHA